MSYKVITISREFGSGGRFIGEETAKKLGIAFYDREIIAKVADDLGLSEKYVADRGEYAPSKNIFSYAFIGRDINGNSIADQIYSYQQKIIKELAAKEPCVIVGRSADYILSERDDVLNVFIQGNKADKIVRIKEIYSKSDDEAAKMIKDTDKKRSVNYRYCTDQEWGSRKNYDIVLNSSTLGYDNCIDVISRLYR
ncbi:MAG: cytidylate kinase-like family protein [[Eubacterium] rectale]|nr:cytidylate kinase-like family protein [uncultured Agathobacter sp.]MBD8925643.1 cytidylate kinase-like family protein [Agathobacter rectalis]